ncbi:MAG: hypothetical protein WBV94_01735 [Blastocatellia bacterium]
MPDPKKAACIILLVAIPLSASARQIEKPAEAKQTVDAVAQAVLAGDFDQASAIVNKMSREA